MAEAHYKLVKNVTDNSFVGVTLSLAQQVGIIDILIEASTPLTSKEIAHRGNLKERYVREILGCLSGARVISLSTNEKGDNIYCLTDDQKQGIQMNFTKFHVLLVGAMAEVFSQVRDCLPQAGPYGFQYSLKCFETMKAMTVAGSHIRTGKAIEMSPGLHERLEAGIDVIEFGSGGGVDILQLARKYPRSRFTASDIVDTSENLKKEWGDVSNMYFRVVDLCNIESPPDKLYDWAFCFDVIHDVSEPLPALQGIRRLVKQPGGVFTFTDHSPSDNGSHQEAVGEPKATGMYGVSTFMCIREGMKSDDSIVLGPCGGRNVLRDYALKAGFDTCEYHNLNEYQTIFSCK